MSRSSSGSWSRTAAPAPAAPAAPAAPGGDIIDLDRFMRAARPDLRQRDRKPTRNGDLVVDGGSFTRKPNSSSSISSEGRGRRSPRPPRRDKRFSHDSGLSDDSYARRRHRPHRRTSHAENATRSREQPSTRLTGSSGSLRAFRTVCERALRDQQQAIARVAQLCERLADQRENTTPTTSASTSSRSTRDQRRHEKHRTEECKTYKIIMTKLDELNRLFANGRSPPGRVAACPPDARGDDRRARDPPSSVTVSDKIVATDPDLAKVIAPTQHPQKSMKRGIVAESSGKPSGLVERAVGSGARSRRSKLEALRAVTNATALDIAPTREDCPNILTENVVMCESSNEASSSADCFDLNNPVHLYAQAKRLQALHATTHARAGRRRSPGAARACAGACRACLRALRQCLAMHVCCPTWI